MPVCTVFPCHATSVGIPTLTEISFAATPSDELSTIDLPSLPNAAKCFADIAGRSRARNVELVKRYGKCIATILVVSEHNSSYRALMGAAVVSTGLHPVATNCHRAPPCTVGLASVYQKQSAFRVGAWPKPPGTGDPKGVPGEHRAYRSPRAPVEGQTPVHATSAHRRAKGDGSEEALQRRRGLFAADHRLQCRPSSEERGQLGIG